MLIDSLGYHLSYNIYPPVPVEFHDAIRMAVEYVKHDSPDVPVLMPNGKTPTAIQVVTDLGLEDLILADEVYDDGDDAPYGRPSA